jgi:hypothetical protein
VPSIPNGSTAVVSNVESFTRQLDEAGGGLGEIMAGVDEAVSQVVRFSDGANETLARVDTIVASVDPERSPMWSAISRPPARRSTRQPRTSPVSAN